VKNQSVLPNVFHQVPRAIAVPAFDVHVSEKYYNCVHLQFEFMFRQTRET